MAFHFSGRSFVAGDRLKLPTPAVVPSSAGLIGLCRPAAANFFERGFYPPGGSGGWIMGRAPSNSRMGLYRPQRTPVLQASIAAGANTVTTVGFTPPANCVLIAFSAVRDTVAPGTSNCLTTGQTWTLIPGADVAANDGGTVFLRMRAFYLAIGSTPPVGMTVATTTAAADHNSLEVFAIVGGGTDFANVATGTGTTGAATATLPTAPQSNGIILSAFHDRTFNTAIVPPSGYTMLYQGNVGTNGKIAIACNEAASSGVVGWNQPGETLCMALAIELRCPALVEHSSATWVDDKVQSFLAFSASTSEHYLALNDAGSLQTFSTSIPIDSTSALALGTFDMALARGGFTGEHFWLGVLKAMPPLGPLDQVLRQLQPPTILRPWLAHLFPLIGRNPERCVFTNVALNIDSGTTLATIGVPQPQVQLEEGPFEVSTGTSRRRVRVTARNATSNTVLTLDAGPSGQVAAIVVSLPAPGGTTGLGVAYNGGALNIATLPSAAPVQQGELFVGTSILDGAPQSEAGSVRLGALAIGPAWTTNIHASLWAIASSWLRPIVDPIALVGESGTPYSEDLGVRIKDPARAGYSLALTGISAGLTASIGGSFLNWSAAVSGNYNATLTVTSLLGGTLAPVTQVALSFTVGLVVDRYANGYQWRAKLRRPAWPGGGLETTLLLPFAELSDSFKLKAAGGLVVSGLDIRFEGSAGQIAHRILAYDGSGGRAAILLNLQQDLGTTEEISVYLGKSGLAQSEENTALTRQGGWVAWHSNWDLQDLSNLGHTLTDNGTIVDTAIGSWPAGHFNGSSTWRSRTSSELNAQSGFFVAALVQSNEPVGRSQELLNIAPNDVAQLAMRLTSQGYWTSTVDVGGQLLSVSSDTELYVVGEPHAFGVYWNSGSAPGAVLDGRAVEPSVQPPVATGVTAMNETLEIGRGNRPPGTASYWNGPIGPVLMAAGTTTQAQRELITAALKEPRLVYGLSDFQSASNTQQPFMAMPLQGTATRGTDTAFDVVANAYNPDGVPLTVVVPLQPANVAATVAGDEILVNPNSSAGNRVLLAYDLLSSSSLTSTGIIDLTIGAAVGGGGGTDDFPAGYPARPDFSTATVVTVNSNSAAQAALNGTIPAAGLVVQLLAAGNDYGSLTINKPGAKIKLLGLSPRFDGLITRRDALRRDGAATIDQTNLTPASASDSTIEQHCIIGGLKAHSATSRCSLSVTACGTLWVEGLDFFNTPVTTSGGGTYRLRVESGTGCDQLWVTKCSGDRTDAYIFGIGSGSEGSSTSDRRGANIFVAWENYLFGEGTIRDPGTSGTVSGVGVLTDYGMRFYNTPNIYLWKNIFAGGYNHSVSNKHKCLGQMYVDDCIFASYHPIADAWAYLELGQAADLANNDRTAGLTWARGCTFTNDVSGGANSGRMLLLKNTVGVRVQNCTVYASAVDFFITGVGGTGNTGTFTDTGVHPGSQDVLVENNRFCNSTNTGLGQPPTTALSTMQGFGYTFTARNNTYSTVRQVSSKSSAVTFTPNQTNPGFSL